jgi:putative Ca2+/H+ antiporter (TMEM165/GDT1 family)
MFIAELGDKTQLLALSFSTRTKPLYIILAVVISTLLMHILAVFAGHFISIALPEIYLQIIVSAFFIFFGIYELFNAFIKNNTVNNVTTYSFFYMLIAFLIAEIGDKSQLATMALAIKYRNPFVVLTSTTLGVVTADILAIYLGTIIGKKIDNRIIRLISSAVFLAFGLYNLFLIF